MKPIFNVSLMCMDFLEIRRQMEISNRRAGMYHIDIMDGHFVPNITLSPDLAKANAPVSDLPLDFHMMVTDPQQYIDSCARAAAPLTARGVRSFYSPHAEVINGKAFRIIDQISGAGLRPGVAVNPETPLSWIMAYLHRLDKVTFMSVDPGFAGQPFIPEVLDKVREARALRDANPERYRFIIEIDGSCNKNTYRLLRDAGAESFVMGSTGLFKNDPDLEKAYDIMAKEFAQAVGANDSY